MILSLADSQRRSFLDAIAQEPADDLHRLVYADWLSDHGEEARADFIRLCLASPNRLPVKAGRMLDTHLQTWLLDPLEAVTGLRCYLSRRQGRLVTMRCVQPDNGRSAWVTLTFRRGFPCGADFHNLEQASFLVGAVRYLEPCRLLFTNANTWLCNYHEDCRISPSAMSHGSYRSDPLRQRWTFHEEWFAFLRDHDSKDGCGAHYTKRDGELLHHWGNRFRKAQDDALHAVGEFRARQILEEMRKTT